MWYLYLAWNSETYKGWTDYPEVARACLDWLNRGREVNLYGMDELDEEPDRGTMLLGDAARVEDFRPGLSLTCGCGHYEVDSQAEAGEIVRRQYPNAVFYSADGFEVFPDVGDPPTAIHGRVWLAWADEESSIDDDGSSAIAELCED